MRLYMHLNALQLKTVEKNSKKKAPYGAPLLT